MAAIETLGAATVLCTDKTGTLTQNRMTIVALRTAAEAWRPEDGHGLPTDIADLVRYGILASAREPFDPMEKAFHAFGEQALPPGDQPNRGLVLKWEYGLRPDLLAVTNVWDAPGGTELLVAAKGAPEAIAGLCGLSGPDRERLGSAVDEMAREGMRVLGVARASLCSGIARPESPRGLPFTFLGLVGLADPLRPAVPAAVRECRLPGIRVVMITGDYPQTARAIAAQAGLDSTEMMMGTDLERVRAAELAQRVRTATIFARTRLLQGAVVLAFIVCLFVLALRQGLPEADARSLTFAALVATNLGLVLINRSQGAALRESFRRKNAALWWVAGSTAVVLAAIVAIEPARGLFHFGPLHADDIALVIASGAAVLLVLAVAKRPFFKGQLPSG